MSAAGPARLLALAVVIAGAAGGCATLDTWRKCGAGCPGDAGISDAVRARLYQHTELLAPNRVYVSTLDGVVYLSGEVVTDTQRLDAEDIARATPGVTRLVDVISLEFQGR
ncbi:MAG TPA: BON domain-containing protein [Gemmatimonadales bacterium]|jgi:osmotically-inducible protein OsmY|nr:BON domain-containing protein [Gemmatimonadales bacterium]